MPPLSLSTLDIRHIRMFASIVEHEGLSAAAAATGFSLTGISRALSDLEIRLGMRLCHRGRSGFQLTPQGQEVYQAAQKFLTEVREFETSLAVAGRSSGARLRVGMLDNVISNYQAGITQALARVRAAHPELFVEMSILPPRLIEIAVRERRLDVGYSAIPAFLKPLEYHSAFLEDFKLCAAARSDAREQAEAFLAQRRPDMTVPYVSRRYTVPPFAEFEAKYPFQTVATADGVESLAFAVAAGLGCGLLPAHVVDALHGLDLVALETPDLALQFYIFYRQDQANAPAIRTIVDGYKQQAAASAAR